jgi:Protein of unknown function (DUF3617)
VPRQDRVNRASCELTGDSVLVALQNDGEYFRNCVSCAMISRSRTACGGLTEFHQSKTREEIWMRKAIFAAVLCLSASAALTAQLPPATQLQAPSAQLQPLNVKTGLWQVTEVSTVTATIPPELQARLSQLPPATRAQLQSRFGGTPRTTTYNTCVTPADLAKFPFQGPNEKCNWTTLTSTGSDMVVHGTVCRAGGNNDGTQAEADLRIHVISSENATGSVQISVTGNQTMNSSATFTGTWQGATCTGTN